jgi:hypothetical protein
MREGGGPVDGGDGTGGGQGCCTGWRTGLWRGETESEADGAAAEDAGEEDGMKQGCRLLGGKRARGCCPGRASIGGGVSEARRVAQTPLSSPKARGSGNVLFEPKGSGSGRQAGLRRGGSGA